MVKQRGGQKEWAEVSKRMDTVVGQIGRCVANEKKRRHVKEVQT